MATSTRIALCPGAPPVRYSGPAPVSTTYFRIQPAPLPISYPGPPSVAVEAQLVSATSTAVAVPEEKVNTPVVSAAPPLQPVRPGPIGRISGSTKRFISSFRGRTVHGIEASLPKGYSGIVLHGDAEGRTQTTTGKAKRQPAVPEDNMAGILPPEEERPVRVLKPSARFDSFVLWHPNIPVNEEMDEYLRSLSEWVNIASEIHESEALPTWIEIYTDRHYIFIATQHSLLYHSVYLPETVERQITQ
ncbi:hypothetical protein EDB85DRAFT_2017430, partial [Lactarius pseudohatsudake]